MLKLRWLPANFQIKCHDIGLPCMVLNVCSTGFLFSLFFSFTILPPHHPPLQSISRPNLETPCCESDGAAGGVCAPTQSLNIVISWMLWLPNSPFVSTQSVLQGQCCFPPRRLGMLRAHRVATEHLSW